MDRIRSATIVILLAPSSGTVGLSTTDDYSDFEQVCIDPQRDSFDGSKISQKASLEKLSNSALDAAGRSDKVVIRYVTNSSQDFQNALVDRLIAGGASDENITVVRLAMDQGTEIHRNFYRTNYCTWRPKTVLA